jgi:hypothetical protein
VPFRDLMRKGTVSPKGARGAEAAGSCGKLRREVKAVADFPSVERTQAGVRLAASSAAAKTSYRSPRGT